MRVLVMEGDQRWGSGTPAIVHPHALFVYQPHGFHPVIQLRIRIQSRNAPTRIVRLRYSLNHESGSKMNRVLAIAAHPDDIEFRHVGHLDFACEGRI